MAPVLKRLTMNYPPIMAHGLNTITAYKGQVIYDTPATEAKAQTHIPYSCSGYRRTDGTHLGPARTEMSVRCSCRRTRLRAPTAGAAVHARTGGTAARIST